MRANFEAKAGCRQAWVEKLCGVSYFSHSVTKCNLAERDYFGSLSKEKQSLVAGMAWQVEQLKPVTVGDCHAASWLYRK